MRNSRNCTRSRSPCTRKPRAQEFSLVYMFQFLRTSQRLMSCLRIRITYLAPERKANRKVCATGTTFVSVSLWGVNNPKPGKGRTTTCKIGLLFVSTLQPRTLREYLVAQMLLFPWIVWTRRKSFYMLGIVLLVAWIQLLVTLRQLGVGWSNNTVEAYPTVAFLSSTMPSSKDGTPSFLAAGTDDIEPQELTI
jgi:hypothetical protein